MIVYTVFRIDCDDVFLDGIFATEELAKDYCNLMNATEEAEWYTWYLQSEEVVTEPFWLRKEEE